MNSAEEPVKLATVLFGSTEGIRESLNHRFVEHSVPDLKEKTFGHLTAGGVAALLDRLAEVSEDLFNLDLVTLLGAGWRKYSELVEAAKHTAASVGETELVQLASHRMTFVQRPSVDLYVDESLVHTVHFEIMVELLVRFLVARIERGKITALQSGTCDVAARLLAENLEIAHGSDRVDLHLHVDLPNGLALLPEANGGGD